MQDPFPSLSPLSLCHSTAQLQQSARLSCSLLSWRKAHSPRRGQGVRQRRETAAERTAAHVKHLTPPRTPHTPRSVPSVFLRVQGRYRYQLESLVYDDRVQSFLWYAHCGPVPALDGPLRLSQPASPRLSPHVSASIEPGSRLWPRLGYSTSYLSLESACALAFVSVTVKHGSHLCLSHWKPP